SATDWPALEWPVKAPISKSPAAYAGWLRRRRRISPPAQPVAPAIATLYVIHTTVVDYASHRKLYMEISFKNLQWKNLMYGNTNAPRKSTCAKKDRASTYPR